MKKIRSIFITIVLLVVLVFVWNKYQETNMNIFSRAEFIKNGTEFTRDNVVKYSEHRSYKMKSEVYNDSILYTTVDVKPNTVYRVTCMVKTNNVVPEEPNTGAGACISMADTSEQSTAITGTHDWQMIELKFNSKNRESIEIGFRLGGNSADCTGEAWFSDLKIEEGFADKDSTWNFACFVIKNLDVEIMKDGQFENVQISMKDSEISNIKLDVDRFETACKTLSNGRMTADCEIIYIDQPLTSLTYEQDTGYFVSAYNVENLINDYVQAGNYDHIFVVIKLDSEQYSDTIEINNWVGLGYMDYQGIGFSNIRLPSDESKFMYIYDSRINVFPEEVFMHEFLHSLERTSNEYGFETVELHANAQYGYLNDSLKGLKDWYSAYMRKRIYDSSKNKYVGLDERVYTLKPANNEDFRYSNEIEDAFPEPENIIDEIKLIFEKVTNNFKIVSNN